MRKPRRPAPEVMESDYRVPTAAGSVAWAVALVVLLAMGERLPAADRWWMWVCVTGITLGVFAYFYIPRLLRKRAEAEARHAARRAADGDGEE
ncbi:DUF2530 domain-containing protein [Marinitenerispora sediminis]|uniref:DUF2530 domain-containing protein n=1 Tax=Marinitenerispora sediminis TaxID=1931232 RepID=A0A368T6F6_9ACTN|nr:DUF2530 domain-containing protein [Marinitenerispora sediminis]RCV54881.1 DUF2530 domain-containing protein [Marinitenerispora sediminis]RCV59256.1 DUF2530 domain-containing protein [Marinitenerispora sediminis]RCV60282.1 DUF2530 domain-containing protein [Marinitenerispora sediminis]